IEDARGPAPGTRRSRRGARHEHRAQLTGQQSIEPLWIREHAHRLRRSAGAAKRSGLQEWGLRPGELEVGDLAPRLRLRNHNLAFDGGVLAYRAPHVGQAALARARIFNAHLEAVASRPGGEAQQHDLAEARRVLGEDLELLAGLVLLGAEPVAQAGRYDERLGLGADAEARRQGGGGDARVDLEGVAPAVREGRRVDRRAQA